MWFAGVPSASEMNYGSVTPPTPLGIAKVAFSAHFWFLRVSHLKPTIYKEIAEELPIENIGLMAVLCAQGTRVFGSRQVLFIYYLEVNRLSIATCPNQFLDRNTSPMKISLQDFFRPPFLWHAPGPQCAHSATALATGCKEPALCLK